MPREHIHFVTGRLAEDALRHVVEQLAEKVGFDYSIDVLNITVAALMTPGWVAPRLQAPPETTRIVLPGYCRGDLSPIEEVVHLPVERGPKDLRGLPAYFGKKLPEDYGAWDIEILAEINHAPDRQLSDVLAMAEELRSAGADIIDVGCNPQSTWNEVGTCVRELVQRGLRVSIDSFDPVEVREAVEAGAELVLSVNRTNCHLAADWGCEVVVMPDEPGNLASLAESVEVLEKAGVRYRIDPILEPLAVGFAGSIERALEARRRWPEAEMLLGIGNVTELTDADTAGINVLLLALCQELGIRSILTTQVINWARSSVRECDLARRLVHYAVRNRVIPKHLEPSLVLLRDGRIDEPSIEELDQLAEQLRDPNVRLFNSAGEVHAVTTGVHVSDSDPFHVFAQLLERSPREVDASHAFYLGYEMCKAVTALTLGKQYQQDEALDWGFLTRPEVSHRHESLERQIQQKRKNAGEDRP